MWKVSGRSSALDRAQALLSAKRSSGGDGGGSTRDSPTKTQVCTDTVMFKLSCLKCVFIRFVAGKEVYRYLYWKDLDCLFQLQRGKPDELLDEFGKELLR
ncbi:hypothetical protein ATANTOWER_024553 [Ataeniobius toweri]|uniref:Uncharacterized protein n=1 Tax=Ataeniobius toweri TaxID=208326 RepID=A0ABU7BB12_9TELE|nr:hypothetical protein [Ataeniobius toweri]